MKRENLWGVQREPSKPVVPDYLFRIAEHSPELVVQIKHYLEMNGEPLDRRRTHDGTDASARLSLHLVEALLTFEQLRLELLEQSMGDSTIVPAHITLAMSEAMRLEPALLHLAKTAMQMHLYVWNAHDLPAPGDEEEGTDGQPSQVDDDRGRWST